MSTFNHALLGGAV